MAVKTTDEFVIPISVRDEVTDKLKKIELAVKQITTSLGKTDSGSGLAQTASNLSKVSKASKDAESSISIYGMTLGKMSAAVFTANAYLDFFNRTLRTVTVVLGGAVAPAVELEKGLAQLNTVLPDNSNLLNQFSADIIEFQKKFGSNQTDVIRGYYDVLQSGAVEAAEATKVLDTAQKMAVAGFTTSDKMIQGLVSVMANYNMTAEDTVRVADLMAIANKNGRVTIEGLAENIGVVAGLAANMNISLEETLSAMSTISMATSNASEAMTSFRAIITGLSTQTGDFSAVMQKLGYDSIQAMIAQKGFLGTINALISESGVSAEALSNIFGRVEAKTGLVALTAEKTGKVFTKNMAEMEDAAYKVGDVIDTQFGKAMGSADQRLQQLKGSFSAMLSEAGLGFMQDLKSLYESLITVVDNLGSAIKTVKSIYSELTDSTVALTSSTKDLITAFTILTTSVAIVKFEAIVIAFVRLAPAIKAASVAAGGLILLFGKIAVVSAIIYGLYLGFQKLKEIILDTGYATDQTANKMLVGTNNILTAQKNLTSEMIDTSAVMSTMGDKFRTSEPEEYFSKAYRSVKSYNDELAESISKFGKQTKEMKKIIPEARKLFAGLKIDLSSLARYEVFGSTNADKFRKGIVDAKAAMTDLKKAYKSFYEGVRLDPKKSDELNKNFNSALEKYAEALANYQKLFREQIEESTKDIRDMYLNIELKYQPFTKQLEELKDRIEKFSQETEDMLKFNPTLDAAINFNKATLDQALQNKNISKDELKSLQRIYDKSVKLKEEHLEAISARKEGLLILNKELEALRMYAKYEVGGREIAEKGGKPIFSTEELVATEQTLNKPLNNFTTSLGQVMRDYFAFNKFRDISNYMSEMIYKGFYLGIEDFTDEMSDFWGKAPQMGDVPGMMSNTALSEAMSAMSSAMSSFMGAVSAASQIATAITSAANIVANLPQQFADMFKAITDMPKTFIKGLNNILTEVTRMFAELIPGLLDAFIAIVDFLPKLVDAIFEGLMKLFDSDVFYKLGKAVFKYFLLGVPTLALMIFKAVVGVVKLVVKVIKEIPRYIKEFVEGFGDAIKEFINEIANTLGFKDVFNVKTTIDEKSLGNISEAIKNGSQQMFSVVDLEGQKKGTGIMAKILAAIDKAVASLKGVLRGLWAVWTWVRDKILMPLWDAVVDAWKWVWKNLFSPIWLALKKAWLWIWNKIFSPMLSELKKDFKKMLDNFKKVWLKIWEPLNNKIIKPLQKLFGKLFNGLMTFIGKIMSGVMKIFGLTRPLMNGFGKILNGFSKLIGSIPNIISKIFSGIKSIFNKIPSYLKTGLSKVGKYLTAGLEKVADFFVKLVANLNPFELINQVFKLLSSAGSFLSSAGSKMISGLVNGLSRVWDAFINLGSKIVSGIKDGLSSVFSFFYDLGRKIISGIKSAISNIWDKFKELGNKIVDGLKDFISDAWDKFKELGKKVIDGIKDFLSDTWDKFKELGGKVIDGIKSGLSALWDGFTNLGTKIWEGLQTGLGKLATLLSPITDTFGKIGSFVSDAFESLDLTKLGNTIGNGIKSIIEPLLSAFKSIGNLFVDMLNGLKIPRAGWSISAGSFGSWSGTLWDEIDLIPGEISRFATGGMAMGTDIVPAMLTPGEFIVNKNATSKNIDLLRSINAGREPISSGSSPTFNITINAKTNLDADSIKREIMPTIEKELKRKSLDGSFVIAANGIRK